MTALKLLAAIALAAPVKASTIITFDQFKDSNVITNQIPGLSFTNTIVLTAGISLNELEIPPHSSPNVVSDNGGPLSIAFADPVSSFSGFFTYTVPLTLQAFDSTHTVVDSAASSFASNLALSGDPRSSPNEFLQLISSTPIVDVLITGAPGGGSFAMDDVSFQSATTVTPEPAPYALVLLGMLTLFGACTRKRI